MANEIIFIIHCLMMALAALGSLALGSWALVSFICLQMVISNLFVVKPIVLFGFTATAADACIIAGVCAFHLLQEFYGKQIAQKTIMLAFCSLLLITLSGQIHLWYEPALIDQSQSHFSALLTVLPRISCASLISYLITGRFDVWLFNRLDALFSGRRFAVRNALCACISQTVDTCLFSFLALWGVIQPLHEVILTSMVIKLIALAFMSPCIALARMVIVRQPISNRSDCMLSLEEQQM